MANAPNVQIVFTTQGVDRVLSAFKSIEQAAQQHQAKLSQTAKKGEDDRAKAADKSEKRETENAKKEAKKRQDEKERAFANLKRETERWHREEVSAEKRKNRELEAETRRSTAQREAFLKGAASRITSSIGRSLSAIGRIGGLLTAVGGGFSIADAVSEHVKNSASARIIALNSNGTISKEEALGTARGVATTQGFKTSETLEGLDQFVAKTGNAAIAKQALPDLAKMANITGADLKDLARSAGLVFNSLDPSEQKGPEKMLEIMRNLAGQGRQGAIDMRDFATGINRITNSAAQFKGDITHNSATLGALAQMATTKGTAGSAAEATESVVSLPRDIAENQKQFNALHITTKDKYGQLIDPKQIIQDAITATAGDATKLQKLFGSRSFRAVQGYQRTFQKTYAEERAKGKSDKDARQLGFEEANKALEVFAKATITKAQIEKENAERLSETDKKLDKIFEKLRQTIGDKVVPKLEEMLPTLERLIPKIADFLEMLVKLVDWIARNPLQAAIDGLGLIIAKAFVQEIAAAQISKIISQGLGAPAASTAVSLKGLGIAAGTAALALAAFAALHAGAGTVQDRLGPEDGLEADAIVRDATHGNKEALKRVQDVEDEGTGFIGSVHRFQMGVMGTGIRAAGSLADPILGTDLSGYGRGIADDAAVREHIASQLEYEDMPSRMARATSEMIKAMEKHAHRINNLPLPNQAPGAPPPPPTNGAPSTTDGNK